MIVQWWKSRGYNIDWKSRGLYVRNGGVVLPGGIYRGALPDEDQWEPMARVLGVEVVINLMDVGAPGRAEAATAARDAGMTVLLIPFDDKTEAVDHSRIRTALAYLDDVKNHPVFVHCKGGRHRTGGVIAAYRISHGWPRTIAREEADQYGFYTAFGHEAWAELMQTFHKRSS
jgi:protein tyrosine/serine phosphatase